MISLVLILIVCTILYVYYSNKELYRAGDKFPGPRAFPLLGNSLDFASSSYGIFSKFNEFSKKYERFFRVWNNGKLYVICNKYKDAEILLSSTTNLEKSDSYRFLKPWIGDGLLSTSEISIWRKHRKIITPTFHFKILHDFLEIFNRNAEIMCEVLETYSDKGPFDVSTLVKLMALDNICETALGVNMNAQRNSESEYVRAVKTIANVVSLRFFKVWLMIDALFYLSKYRKIQNDALKILRGTTNKIIQERRKRLKEEKMYQTDGYEERKKLAFLDLLLESEEGFRLTDKELREEVDTFAFAGHDTISSALSFTLYCLAVDQKIQEAAYKEQMSILGESDRIPTYADIQEMKYLERVIKEVLRLYPSAPIIGRELQEDVYLAENYHLPKGTQMIVNIYALHRDPSVWPNPEAFNPDNFLPDAIQSRKPYTYIPFSAGARNCLGQKYAMLALKVAAGMILRRYKILPSSVPEHIPNLAAEIVLVSVNGIHIKTEKRT